MGQLCKKRQLLRRRDISDSVRQGLPIGVSIGNRVFHAH